jgi:hypothetical protein
MDATNGIAGHNVAPVRVEHAAIEIGISEPGRQLLSANHVPKPKRMVCATGEG